MPHVTESLGLDLANTLTRELKMPADLLECTFDMVQ